LSNFAWAHVSRFSNNLQFRDLSAEWFKPQPAEVHTFGEHIQTAANSEPQGASTANPERCPDSPLSMTRDKHSR
jgi:hypothetical protein